MLLGWGLLVVGRFFKDKIKEVDFGFHLFMKYNDLSSFRNYLALAPQDKKKKTALLWTAKIETYVINELRKIRPQTSVPQRIQAISKTSQTKDYAPLP